MQPCPYCGADTRISTVKKRIGKATPHIFESAQIKCKRNSCGMSGPLFKGEGSRDRAQRHWDGCYFHPTMRKAQTPLSASS